MKLIGQILQQYRKQNNLTQSELATILSQYDHPIKNGMISAWEKNNSIPNTYQFLTLCQVLGITDIYDTFITDIRRIPLRLMGVSAGTGEYINDYSIDNYIETDNMLADYALRINGNSMEPIYRNDQIILVQNTEVLKDGEVGIFYLDGEQYCKQLAGNKLLSYNPDYAPIEMNEVNTFRILGKVVGKIDNNNN